MYPVFLKLSGRRVLLVGGGRVAMGKLAGLVADGAQVTVVAPEIRPELHQPGVRIVHRAFDPADLDEAIMEMIRYDGPVIFDCLVEKHENCFPMIPSGKPHNEMLLGDAETQGVIKAGGAVLV